MTVTRFWHLIIGATLLSIAIGTLVALQFHWFWGIIAYAVSDFILDATVIAYSVKKLK